MKKNNLTLFILLFITSFAGIKAQENENISYNHALNWLYLDAQYVNAPMLNTGANVDGKTFKATDFFEIIKTPNYQEQLKEEKPTITSTRLFGKNHPRQSLDALF